MAPSAQRPFRPRQALFAGLCLFATLLLALAETLTRGGPGTGAVAAYLVALPLMLPFLRRQQLVFLALCTLAGIALFAQGKETELWHALTQSVALAVLLAALVWLRLAAMRSRSLAGISRAVAEQKRSVRHLGLALASHFTGILLNVGVFGLMAPLVAGSNAPPADKKDMALAVNRGFGVTMLWAPTTAAQAVITSVVPGISWEELALRTSAMAFSLILLSWLFSSWEHRKLPAPARSGEKLQPGALAYILGIIALMVALILALHASGGYSLTSSVALAAPFVATAWMLVQAYRHGENPAQVVGTGLRAYVGRELAGAAPELVTLGAAGFLGIAISALIPQAWMEAVVPPLADYQLVLYLTVTLLVPLFSAFGLNPLVAASLIGGGFAAIPAGHFEPLTLAFALASGWAVAYGVSPFTTGAVVLANALATRPEVITRQWNRPFTFFALAYACAVVAVMAL
ncbi:hypothetical protein [Afifella sp. IM 167]|uniref:hypothetical protein n=1 Tax=Afifella sp. IM 167 TaxID=2033586 RepID=UPI001CCD7E1F|nr:hypothetical protein [Afifella sp. IM 167]MBZ8135408.1 hypothetical protein [Afifella sp. IM 167]